MDFRWFNSKYINHLGFAYKCEGTYEGRYAYGGQDYVTKEFGWVVPRNDTQLLNVSQSSHPPTNALAANSSNECLVAAKEKNGALIPGWYDGSNAIYPSVSKAHTTKDFYWIVANMDVKKLWFGMKLSITKPVLLDNKVIFQLFA